MRAGNVADVQRLLHDGADVRAANRYGVTPLSLAAGNGDAATIGVLLAAGADGRATLSDGQTMLMLAARAGSPAALRALVAHGAQVDARNACLARTR